MFPYVILDFHSITGSIYSVQLIIVIGFSLARALFFLSLWLVDFCRPRPGWWSPITLWRFKPLLTVFLRCTRCWHAGGTMHTNRMRTLLTPRLLTHTLTLSRLELKAAKVSKSLIKTVFFYNKPLTDLLSVCPVEVMWRRMHQSLALLFMPSRLSFPPLTRLALKLISAHTRRARPSRSVCSTTGRYKRAHVSFFSSFLSSVYVCLNEG